MADLGRNTFLVVMAGGSGTRFWPKSTSKKPKQLLSFERGENPQSLLQETLNRFESGLSRNQMVIVTTGLLNEAVKDQAPGVRILAEPMGRNTSPCVFWAAKEIEKMNPNAVMLVMPADHYIPNKTAFSKTISEAVNWANCHDDLITLGIKPSRPETGYGYLKAGANLEGNASVVDAFIEKPNIERAQDFFKAGNYYWNAGMFVWKVSAILRAFKKHMPEMENIWTENPSIEMAYPKMTATSIDYGIMEKANNVVMFPLDCGWDDLGSWPSLDNLAERLNTKHEAGVVVSGNVVCIRSSGNIVDVPKKLVALLGVDDLIIVEQGDTLLIAKKSEAQQVKQIVDLVKSQFPDKT